MGKIWFSKALKVDGLARQWEVRFGWRAWDVVLYVFLLLGPLAAVVILFGRSRRKALTGAHDDAVRFTFVRNQTRGLVLIYILWCAWVFLVLPLRIPGYVNPALVPHTALMTWSLVGVLGTALFVWVYARLYEVTSLVADIKWTRRELAFEGLATGAVVFMGIQLIASPATQAFNSATGSIAPSAFLVAVFAGILALWGLHYSSRFLGIESRKVELGPLHERFQVLAAQAGLSKVPALRQDYFTRGYLARAFQLTHLAGLKIEVYRSRGRVDARLVSVCSGSELDTLLMCDLIRIRKHHEEWLGYITVLHLFLGGVAVMAAFVTTLEYDLLGIGTSGSLLMMMGSMVLPAIPFGVLYWLHHAWATRRYIRKEDDTVLAVLDSPEVQISGIFKQAVLCYMLSGPGRWAWMGTSLAPMERARRLNAGGDLNLQFLWDEAVRATQSEENGFPVSRIQDLDNAMNTQAMLAMLVTLPLLIASPVAVAVLHQRLFSEPLPIWIVVLAGSFLCTGILSVQNNLSRPIGYRRIARILMSGAGPEGGAGPQTPALCRSGTDEVGEHESVGILELGEGGICFRGDSLTWQTPWSHLTEISLEGCGGMSVPMLEVCVQREMEDDDSCPSVRFAPLVGSTQLRSNEKALELVNRLLALRPLHRVYGESLGVVPARAPLATRFWLLGLTRRAVWFLMATLGWVLLCGFVLVLAVVFGMRGGGEPAHSPWVACGIFLGIFLAGKLVSWTYRKWMQARVISTNR